MGKKKKQILNEIYERAVEGSDYMKEIECAVDKHMEAIFYKYYHHISETEYEKLKNILYETVTVAEREAFISGMSYGLRLAAESYLQFND